MLWDEGENPALRGILFAGLLTAKVSASADCITVFVSCCLDIKAVKAVARYEQIAGANINFDRSEGLWLGAWRGSVSLPGPFHRSNGHVRILWVLFRLSLQQERNRSEVQAKVDVKVGTWLGRHLSLKAREEAWVVYVFLIFYLLSVLLPKAGAATIPLRITLRGLKADGP